MKKGSTIFLQIVVVLMGIAVLTALLWEPQFEGVNANASNMDIYFRDPFLACVYLGSIPFFVGLYKAFKVLTYVRRNEAFSEATVQALRTIKYCAFITAAAIVGADIFIRLAARNSNDDPAGALMLGFIATIAALTIGTTMGVIEHILKNGKAKE